MNRHVSMTIGDLKKLIGGLDDDLPILVPAFDHSYRPASARQVIAVYDQKFGWCEDYGDSNPPEIPEDARKRVIVVSSE